MPEYIDKLNEKRDEILDSQQRILNEGKRLVQKEATRSLTDDEGDKNEGW
jgi:hypothetical protein